jgi:hypothetical protein
MLTVNTNNKTCLAANAVNKQQCIIDIARGRRHGTATNVDTEEESKQTADSKVLYIILYKNWTQLRSHECPTCHVHQVADFANGSFHFTHIMST